MPPLDGRSIEERVYPKLNFPDEGRSERLLELGNQVVNIINELAPPPFELEQSRSTPEQPNHCSEVVEYATDAAGRVGLRAWLERRAIDNNVILVTQSVGDGQRHEPVRIDYFNGQSRLHMDELAGNPLLSQLDDYQPFGPYDPAADNYESVLHDVIDTLGLISSQANSEGEPTTELLASEYQALKDIQDGLARMSDAEADMLSLVARARSIGLSWAKIGKAFGTSRQAAWERWNPRVRQYLLGTTTLSLEQSTAVDPTDNN